MSKKRIFFGTLIALGFAAVIGLAIGAWYLKRTINYNLMYKECVQQTVKEMVKAECLK
jgi:hypothetical protein